MCQYKPCVLWFHLNTMVMCFMVMFIMVMWMYTGDYYPSLRFQITWYWSLMQYMYSCSASIICSIMLYKEIPMKSLNRLCLLGLLIGVISASILSALVWIPIRRSEFEKYVFDYYLVEKRVPRFMDYFQSRQKCCGISNYTDYININGTYLKTLPGGSQIAVFDVPRSCCFTESQKANRTCGIGISLKNYADIKARLNSDTRGCFDEFRSIIYGNAPYQITIIHDIFRTMPVTQIVYLTGLIAIYWFYYKKEINKVHGQVGLAGQRFKFMARVARYI